MKERVSSQEAGLRLPQFIQAHLGSTESLKKIKGALENKGCRVNGHIERFASYVVREGDRVEFEFPEETKIVPLYEDEVLAIVNKPPFVVCEAEKGLLGHRLAHRLDKETSGCLLLAKTPLAEKELIELFRQREMKKEYLAVVDGVPKGSSGTIELPIKGKEAKTLWKLEKRGKRTSLIRCFPETGRTHQIRIHLASLGHPILGDSAYGKKFSSTYVPSRILLHASRLAFKHPFKEQRVTASAPVPGEFYEALNY